MAPDGLAKEEADLRKQREHGAKKVRLRCSTATVLLQTVSCKLYHAWMLEAPGHHSCRLLVPQALGAHQHDAAVRMEIVY